MRKTIAAVIAVVTLVSTAAAQPLGEPVEIHHIHGLAIDRRDAGVVYVATHTGLVRLKQGAVPAWVGTQRFDFMGFTSHPSEAGVVFASGHPDIPTYQRDKVGNLGLLVSRNGGQTWQSVALRGQADFHAMTYSPRDGGRLFGWSVAGEPGLYRVSTTTWKAERLTARGLDNVISLAASTDPRGPLLAGTASGLRVSNDGGATWTAATGLPASVPVTAVVYHPIDARRVYAYVHKAGGGLHRSEDGGRAWRATGFVAGADTPVIALTAGHDNDVAMATTAADVARSGDGGSSWIVLVTRGRVVTR
jgi:photosystem II stability/assembly factor-like uncharacterized protein